MLQFAENVNPIGIVLCVKTPSGICYRTSDWEISPCVMNPTVTGHMSWMLSLWWRPERRTAAIHVLSFPKASRFLVSESDFTCTAYGMRSSWAGWYPRHCWKPTISKFFFFLTSQRTVIWRSVHQWRNVDRAWHFQASQALVVTTGPCHLTQNYLYTHTR